MQVMVSEGPAAALGFAGSPSKLAAVPEDERMDSGSAPSFSLPAQLDLNKEEHLRAGAAPMAEDDDEVEGDDEAPFTPFTPGPAGIGEPLTPEAASNIVKQIEFYFSDASLPTDKKLLKAIRKDPQGFVSVKMFANFRKVRAITRDPDAISLALKDSQELKLSDDGKMVRRLVPVPAEYDVEDIQKRTVVVENLPLGSTIESVTKMMRQYGNVKLVRICNRETKGKLPLWLTSSLGSVVLQSVASGGLTPRGSGGAPEKPPHAYVEYDTEDEAVMAVAALHDTEGWRPLGINVHHLIYECSDTPKPQPKTDTARAGSGGINRTSSLAPRRSQRDGPLAAGLVPTMSERPGSAGSSWRAPLIHSGNSLALVGSGGSIKPQRSTAVESNPSTGSSHSAGSNSIPATRGSRATSLGSATAAGAGGHSGMGGAAWGSDGDAGGSPSKRGGSAYVPPALRGGDSSRLGSCSPSHQPSSPLKSGAMGSPLRSSAVNGALFAPLQSGAVSGAVSGVVSAAGALAPQPTSSSSSRLLASASSMLRSDAPEWQPGAVKPSSATQPQLQPQVLNSSGSSNVVPASPFEAGGAAAANNSGGSPTATSGGNAGALRSQLVNASFTGLSVFGKQAQLQAQLQAAQRAASLASAGSGTGSDVLSAVSDLPARSNTASGGMAAAGAVGAAARAGGEAGGEAGVLNPSQLSLRPIKTGHTGSSPPGSSPAAAAGGSPAAAGISPAEAVRSSPSPSAGGAPRATPGSPLHHAAVTAAQQQQQLVGRGSGGSAPKFVLDLPPGTNNNSSRGGSQGAGAGGNNSRGGSSRPGSSASSSPLASQLRPFGSVVEPAVAAAAAAAAVPAAAAGVQFQPLSPLVRAVDGNQGGAANPFGSGQFLMEVEDRITRLLPAKPNECAAETAIGTTPAAAAADPSKPADATPAAADAAATTGDVASAGAAAGADAAAQAEGGDAPTPAAAAPAAGGGPALVARESMGRPPRPLGASMKDKDKDFTLRPHQSFPLPRTSSAGGNADEPATTAPDLSPGSDHESGDEAPDAATPGAGGTGSAGGGDPSQQPKRRRKRGSRAGSRSRRNSLASHPSGGGGAGGEGGNSAGGGGGLPHRHSMPQGVGSGGASNASTPEHHHNHHHGLPHRGSGHQHRGVAGVRKEGGAGAGSDSSASAREPKARRHSGKPDYASWAAATPEYRAESARLAHAGGAHADTPPRSPRRSVTPGGAGGGEGTPGAPGTPPHHHGMQGGPSQGGLVVVAHGPDGTRGFVGRGRGAPMAAPPPA